MELNLWPILFHSRLFGIFRIIYLLVNSEKKLKITFFIRHFSCDKPSMADIRAVISASRFAVKTIVAINLDPNVTILPQETFLNGSVCELRIDGSKLVDMHENAFEGTVTRLHTLTINNGKLTSVPRAVGKISSLKRLSLESNRINDIYAYAFFSQSKLSYLNLKDNRLEAMAENVFLGMLSLRIEFK